MNATVLTGNVRSLTELDEVVLTGVALPAFRRYPRRIDAPRRAARTAAPPRLRPCRDREPGAISLIAIHRARNPQIRRQWHGFIGVCQELADRGGSAGRVARLTARR